MVTLLSRLELGMQQNRHDHVSPRYLRITDGIYQGLSKGNNIPSIGPVSISWYTGPQSNIQASKSLSSTTPGSFKALEDKHGTRDRSPLPEPVSPLPEEVVVSGWGGEGDDGDGMGML
jgi:RNA-binding protein 26